jgi:hypothetical protein
MYLQNQFSPGASANSSRMITYIAEYNSRFPTAKQLTCNCKVNSYNKFAVSSNSASTNVSYKTRISQLIKYTNKGGKTEFGNFYLGENLNLNYLGRVEGMPGGGGKPPTNKF